MKILQSLTRNELAELIAPHLTSRKVNAKVHATQIYRWVYQRFVWKWQEMSDIPLYLREWLSAHVEILQLNQLSHHVSDDGTCKFLWGLNDNKTIESVLIPAKHEDSNRLTICISTQVGCAMGCKFCLTGVQGLDRHLSAAEIVTQVMHLRSLAAITNIVFMGMGEPLHNVDNVVQAIKIMLDQAGMNFSKRKVTVSTSGIVPAIKILSQEVGVMLAVSLNASNDEQRNQIMPVNKKWNIETLLKACQNYPTGTYRMITYEYVLLAGINDSIEDAKRLVALVKKYPAKINLIPFNEHPGSAFKRPTQEVVQAFQNHLIKNRVIATVRHSRGRDILAACGQLRSLFGTAKGTDKFPDQEYRNIANS